MRLQDLAQHRVLAGVNNGVALIRYNRPESANSLHPELQAEFLSALQWAISDAAVKVIVVTGEGRFYSTGMELKDVSFINDMTAFDKGKAFHELNRVLIECDKVLVAAVNGPAAGYGVSQLGLFDLVYSVPDAYFFTPFVKWGMAAEGASSVVFPMAIGYQKAASLFLAADRVGAEELERAGLITKILPKENFRDQVIAIAEDITNAPYQSLMATKKLMRAPIKQLMLDANDRECEILTGRLKSGEPQVIIQDFLVEQKRKKEAKGKSNL